MPVRFNVVMVPDYRGNRVCNECHGEGLVHIHRRGKLTRVRCKPCNGYGLFRAKTKITSTRKDFPLLLPGLSRDVYGHIHISCGGKVRFIKQSGVFYWSCTKCRRGESLSPSEWELAQNRLPPLNPLADARGAEEILIHFHLEHFYIQ